MRLKIICGGFARHTKLGMKVGVAPHFVNRKVILGGPSISTTNAERARKQLLALHFVFAELVEKARMEEKYEMAYYKVG